MNDVVLENTGRQPLTLLLTHDAVCTELRCLCSRQKQVESIHDPTTGRTGHRVSKIRVGEVVTLFAAGRPGASSAPLPASALRASDVAKAIRVGVLKVHEVAEVAPGVLMPADQAAEIADAVAPDALEPTAFETVLGETPTTTETRKRKGG